jgi:cytochrome b
MLEYHAIIGLSIGVLLLFRIIWGFMDIRYSKFKDFTFSFYELKEYMLNIFGEKKEYISHNPASSWAVVFIIVLALLAVITGMLTYGTKEGMGIFSSLNNTMFKKMELFEEMHEFFANSLLVVIGAHIAGVVIDKIVHKTKTIESMIDGKKDIDSEDLKLTLIQNVFAFIWIASTIIFLVYLLSNKQNILLADNNQRVDYQKEHPLFYDECKSCHTLYPPYLLPKNSWEIIMSDLENHFGDDASLDKEDALSIKDYLLKHSAENSTKESAYTIVKSIKDADTIEITKTSYWKKRHTELQDEISTNPKVLKASNCKACHVNIEQGLLNDKDIKIPSKG